MVRDPLHLQETGLEVLLVLGGGPLHPLHPLHSLVDGDPHHHRVAPDGDPDLLHQDAVPNWAVEDQDQMVVGQMLVIS